MIEKKIISYEDLKNKIDLYKSILNKKSYNYLLSLINLDSFCLNENELSIYLKELNIFKDIILFNLYYSSFKLVDESVKYYNEKNTLNFNIKNTPILLLDYISDTPTLNLYNGFDIDSLEERRIYYLNKLERTKSYLEMEERKVNPYESTSTSLYNSSYAWSMKQQDIITRLKGEIERLSNITDDDIRSEINFNQLIIENRNRVLERFNSLCSIDFNNDIDSLGRVKKVKKLGYANIVIQNNDIRKSDF